MRILTFLWAYMPAVLAITMYPDNLTSITDAMNTVMKGMFDYCPWIHNKSGAIPGMFQEPYYWWEAGVIWGGVIDWSTYTNNHTYDHWVKEAIQFQSGKKWDFMTQNQTSVEGNDDQAFWGVTAMNAAEKNFTQPDKEFPPWLYFAQATFNTMANRWSTEACNGGLRWQIYTWNSGYDYKNMVSNGCLFHLAARLAKFTNNQTYVEWAERVWDWAESVGFIDPRTPTAYSVYDGAHTGKNCSDIVKAEWSYDQGLMISGSAYLYNFTGDDKWLTRVKNLWGRATVFFDWNGSGYWPKHSIAYEPSCNPIGGKVSCTNDMRCFKGIFLSLLGITMQVAPEMKDIFWEQLQFSAQAASWSCSGGYDGVTCGLNWLKQGWDSMAGLGEQYCAFASFNTLMATNFTGPYTAADLPEIYHPVNSSSSASNDTSSNGTTVYGWGNQAGMNSTDVQALKLDLDKGDVAGASVLTAIVMLIIIGGSVWLIL